MERQLPTDSEESEGLGVASLQKRSVPSSPISTAASEKSPLNNDKRANRINRYSGGSDGSTKQQRGVSSSSLVLEVDTLLKGAPKYWYRDDKQSKYIRTKLLDHQDLSKWKSILPSLPRKKRACRENGLTKTSPEKVPRSYGVPRTPSSAATGTTTLRNGASKTPEKTIARSSVPRTPQQFAATRKTTPIGKKRIIDVGDLKYRKSIEASPFAHDNGDDEEEEEASIRVGDAFQAAVLPRAGSYRVKDDAGFTIWDPVVADEKANVDQQKDFHRLLDDEKDLDLTMTFIERISSTGYDFAKSKDIFSALKSAMPTTVGAIAFDNEFERAREAKNSVHFIDVSKKMGCSVSKVLQYYYAWKGKHKKRPRKKRKQYVDKSCAKCGYDDFEVMVVCDTCKKGFHPKCVGLLGVPQTKTWVCLSCSQAVVNKARKRPQNLAPVPSKMAPYQSVLSLESSDEENNVASLGNHPYPKSPGSPVDSLAYRDTSADTSADSSSTGSARLPMSISSAGDPDSDFSVHDSVEEDSKDHDLTPIESPERQPARPQMATTAPHQNAPPTMQLNRPSALPKLFPSERKDSQQRARPQIMTTKALAPHHIVPPPPTMPLNQSRTLFNRESQQQARPQMTTGALAPHQRAPPPPSTPTSHPAFCGALNTLVSFTVSGGAGVTHSTLIPYLTQLKSILHRQMEWLRGAKSRQELNFFYNIFVAHTVRSRLSINMNVAFARMLGDETFAKVCNFVPETSGDIYHVPLIETKEGYLVEICENVATQQTAFGGYRQYRDNGEKGPVEALSLFRNKGDRIVGIDGEPCESIGFDQVCATLRKESPHIIRWVSLKVTPRRG